MKIFRFQRNQDFAKERGVEEGLKHEIEFFCFKEMSPLGRSQSKLVRLKGTTDEGQGKEPPPPETIGV